jgi:flagellar biosynthesis/type III secretory pathway protein FliH
MHARRWKPLLLTGAVSALLVVPPTSDPVHAQGRGRGQPSSGRQALSRQVPRGYHESAFTRGYGDGYERGLADGRGRRRYDPVDSRDYRNADAGYSDSYGSRDAYKNNYRAGFRQGYEDGYRDGTR